MNSNAPGGTLRRKDVRRSFDRAAETFDSTDFVHRHVADGLLERLQPMRLEAKTVLDLGSATGQRSRQLASTFRRARVVSVDISAMMLGVGRANRGRFSRVREVQADALQLPFADRSVDLVFANLLLPWIDDIPRCFGEISRVLRREGLFLFSTLGPDSLAELRSAWRTVDGYQHVNAFGDMHDIGDALVRARLLDPVLDVDYLNVSYQEPEKLFADLTVVGARNALRLRPPGLTGRGKFAAFRERLWDAAGDGGLELKLEIVFGHCWGSGTQQKPGEYRVDVGRIGRRA